MFNLLNSENEKKTNVFEIIIISVIIFLILFMIFLTRFWISLSIVDGDSMNPTLIDNDYLITNRLKEPKRGDVVVFNYDKNSKYIKRVIAVEGDTIFNDINGNIWLQKQGETAPTLLEEDYVLGVTTIIFSHTIEKGQIFVLGDNRGNSKDSSSFGPISLDTVVGVVSQFWIEHKDFTYKIFA